MRIVSFAKAGSLEIGFSLFIFEFFVSVSSLRNQNVGLSSARALTTDWSKYDSEAQSRGKPPSAVCSAVNAQWERMAAMIFKPFYILEAFEKKTEGLE